MSKSDSIKYMTETPGWELVEAYIQRRMEAAKNSLLSCPLEEVPKHRATVSALTGILIHVAELQQDTS